MFSLQVTFPRSTAHLCAFIGRIDPATTFQQHQKAHFAPKPAPIAGRTCPTAPHPRIERHFGRTSPVGVRGGCSCSQVQHRAIDLGRSSSIIARDATKQVMGDRHLSHLEDRIAGVSDHPFKINPHHLTPGPYT